MSSFCCNTPTSPAEAPIPWPQNCAEKEAMKPRGLVRKPSKLQMSVEVMKCRFGSTRRRPARNEDGEFTPQKQWTPIYHAVYHNREAALLHFLQNGGSPDDVDGTGLPPLCIAAASGHTRMIEILLEANVDVNAATETKGETALHLAIKNGRNEIIDLLLTQNPDIESQTTETRETCLHYAASKTGSLAVVVALLKSGAKYNAKNTSGQSPAEAALLANNIQSAIAIINSALGKRNALAKEKEMLLKHVEKTRFSTNNELIVDIFATTCDPDSTVLVEAIRRNDASLVEMFLERGADPDRETAKGLRPIFTALEVGGTQIINILLKYNVDVTVRNSSGQSVLQMAFESPLVQDKEALFRVFEPLLSKGAEVVAKYTDGKTLLHRAVIPGICHSKIATRLLEYGVNVKAQDVDGNTALHLAAHDTSCIKALLKHGADAHCINKEGLTPLLYTLAHITKAAEPDLEPLIKVSNLRKPGPLNRTPLHTAAINGFGKTVRGLLRAGADTTIVDSASNTPLLLAVLNKRWPVVSLLATLPGANLRGEDGSTALHHIVTSSPQDSTTWADIAFAIKPFCERGTSRTMRDRLGATPLIQGVRTLPEEGLPVIEALLTQGGEETMSRNCIDHEDHKGHDAFYYAATQGKPRFVQALLKHGATFNFHDWAPGRKLSSSSSEVERAISKHLAQAEWTRRVSLLRSQSRPNSSTSSVLPEVLPIQDLTSLLNMGLDPNALPKSNLGPSLLWALLKQVHLQSSSPHLPEYLHDSISIALKAGADPNFMAARVVKRSSGASKESLPLPHHSLTFLLEEVLTVDANLVALLLGNGARSDVPSPFYGGRYPLHTAVKAQRIDIITALLARRTDTNCQSSDGRTPLFIAAQDSSNDIVEVLLRFGANPNISDNEMNTPLHVAAIGESKSVTAKLLRAGALACCQNAKGLTPRQCIPDTTATIDKDRIIMLLKDAEANETRDRERALGSGRPAVQHAQTPLPVFRGTKPSEITQTSTTQVKTTSHTALPSQPKRQLTIKLQPNTPLPPTHPTSPLAMNPPTEIFASAPKHTTISSLPVGSQQKAMPASSQPETSTSLLTVPQSTSQPQRADSGIGYVDSARTREKSDLDSTSATVSKRQSGDELAGWLAVSKMLGNL